MKRLLFSLLCVCSSLYLAAQTPAGFVEQIMSDEIVVDLREPTYCDGVLTTTKGGVVTGPAIRIQAQNITYTQRQDEDGQILLLEAEGELMAEYNGWLFIGDRMEYDFVRGEGVIYDGRTGMQDWFFGGKRITLQADGTHVIEDGFATTSEASNSDWQILSPYIRIINNQFLDARNIQFRFVKLPIFWFPSYRLNLATKWHTPIKYRARWTGRLGARVGITYQFYKGEEWSAAVVTDYSLRQGLGGGFEVERADSCGPGRFRSIAYYASDRSPYEENRTERYRIWGSLYESWYNDTLSLWISYDKLSDKFMPSDYYQKSINSRNIQPTKLSLRKRSDNWIANFVVHPRLNDFQTIKQELPSLQLNLRPRSLYQTGIISDTWAEASFLNFRYDDSLPGVSDYQSGRFELRQRFYRPSLIGPLLLTPETGFTVIHYTDSPSDHAITQTVALLGSRAETRIRRDCDTWSHAMTPYVHFRSHQAAHSPVTDHYLFDHDDGITNLNLARFGLHNSIYACCGQEARQSLQADLYAYLIADQSNVPESLPRIYFDATWRPSNQIVYRVASAWDRVRSDIDHINVGADVTLSENLAFSSEYRHRSDYAWRKLDPENFFVDVARDEPSLLASRVSDRRDTLLNHLFWRPSPWWAVEWISQLGWNRRNQPKYHEYQIDLHAQLRASWQVRLSYQSRENDSRVAVYLSLGRRKPKAYCGDDPHLLYGNY